MPLRIDAVPVHPRGATGCVYNVFAVKQNKDRGTFLRCGQIKAEQTDSSVFICQYAHNLHPVKNLDTLFLCRCLQAFSHFFRGIWPDAGGAPSGVMVRFISYIFAIAVFGEGNAQFDQPQKALRR